MISCSEKNDEEQINYDFVDVEIPSYLTSTLKSTTEADTVVMDIKVTDDNGNEVIGKMEFLIPVDEDNTLISFRMTSNIFEDTDLTTDFWVNSEDESSLKSAMGIGTCLSKCNEMEKGEGRGWCKGGFWAELAIKAAAVVATIVAL